MAEFPPETKVKVATAWSAIMSTAVLTALSVLGESNLVLQLPDWLAVPVGAALTAGVTYWRAYEAKHSPR